MPTTTPDPETPPKAVTASVHHASPSTATPEADTITFRMGKQTLVLIVTALLGSSAVGSGVVSKFSDSQLDERVSASLDKALDGKLDAKLDGKLKEARDAADRASTSATAAAAAITDLRDIVIRQSAVVEATRSSDSEARKNLEATVRDHEGRLRELERRR